MTGKDQEKERRITIIRKAFNRRNFILLDLAGLTVGIMGRFRGAIGKFLVRFDQPPQVRALPQGHSRKFIWPETALPRRMWPAFWK